MNDVQDALEKCHIIMVGLYELLAEKDREILKLKEEINSLEENINTMCEGFPE